ncbi:MAG: serine/threonine-protein kinase [Gemmataceae bacterium]
MTPLQVKCTSCQADLRLPAHSKPGMKLGCPRCKAILVLPPSPAPAPPPPSPPSLDQTQDSAASGSHATVGSPTNDSEDLSFLAPPQQPDELGRLGGYRVLRELGRGGMGVVLQAEDTQLKRLVALKVMLPHVAAKPAHRQRFLREAQAAAKLEHDHVVNIYQVGEDRGVPFIAMPFLKGESLDSCLQREGPLPWNEVVRIGRETAEALQAAHEAGLIHRDIKPSNLWLEGNRRRVKVLDFGLARLQTSDVQLTNSGAVLGTPAYMSPEQARGEELDGRADLFSLGCVLHRAATGRVAFSGEHIMAVLMAIATHHPPTLDQLRSDAPAGLTTLVTRLLAKSRDDRPASAAEVAQELATIEQTLRGSASATTTPPASPVAPGPRRRPPRSWCVPRLHRSVHAAGCRWPWERALWPCCWQALSSF